MNDSEVNLGGGVGPGRSLRVYANVKKITIETQRDVAYIGPLLRSVSPRQEDGISRTELGSHG